MIFYRKPKHLVQMQLRIPLFIPSFIFLVQKVPSLNFILPRRLFTNSLIFILTSFHRRVASEAHDLVKYPLVNQEDWHRGQQLVEVFARISCPPCLVVRCILSLFSDVKYLALVFAFSPLYLLYACLSSFPS